MDKKEHCFQKYRRPKATTPGGDDVPIGAGAAEATGNDSANEGEKPRPTTSQRTRNYGAARQKIKDIRRRVQPTEKAFSSISLPIFSLARLRDAAKKCEKHTDGERILISGKLGTESKILTACLVMLLAKLKCKHPPWREGVRGRIYNEDKYSYGKVTMYVDRKMWQAFHARAVQLETSLSHLADIAVRLYLQQVLERLLLRYPDKDKKWRRVAHLREGWRFFRCESGALWLQRILFSCSYQKIEGAHKTGCPSRGQTAHFSVNYDIKFGYPYGSHSSDPSYKDPMTPLRMLLGS